MIRRLYVPQLSAGRVVLDDDTAHYVRRVLRLTQGDPIEAFDGKGGWAQGTVEALTKTQVDLQMPELTLEPPPKVNVHLLQALAKSDKIDEVVRQAAELGVAELVIAPTTRSQKAKVRADRWQSIAIDGARVSGRHRLMRVRAEASLAQHARGALRLVLVLGAPPLKDMLAQAEDTSSVDVLIGPEGGLTSAEVDGALQAGFRAVSIGPHTLRTQTAGPAVVAMLQYALGPF